MKTTASLCLKSAAAFVAALTVNPIHADIAVSPTMLEWSLEAGSQSSQVVTLTNNGGDSIDWTAEATQEEDGAAGQTRLLAMGGDPFGYRWADSSESSGPDFQWEDIRPEGTPVALADDESFLLALPFSFVFYGSTYDSIRVSSNGYVTFGADGSDHTSDPIPSQAAPNALIAAFWKDLDPTLGGEIHYFHDEGRERLTIQYTDIQPFGGGLPLSFQIMLHRNGNITLQYQNETVIDVANTEYSIGIENADGSMGSSVARAHGQPDSGTAVRFYSPTWLSVEPEAGTLAGGESTELTVTVNAGALVAGSYAGSVTVTAEDGAATSLPVEVHVSGQPELRITPDFLLFDAVGTGGSSEESITVENTGTASMELSEIVFSDAAFTTAMVFPRQLEPGEEVRIPVQVTPDHVGSLSATAELSTTDPDTPLVSIPLEAEGLPPANLSVSTSPIEVTLAAGDRMEIPLSIENTGIADLEWNAVLDGEVPELAAPVENAAIAAKTNPVPDLDRPHATDRIIVRFAEESGGASPQGASPEAAASRERMASEAGVRRRVALRNISGMEVWELGDESPVAQPMSGKDDAADKQERLRAVINWLNEQPGIAYAEPDYRIKLDPREEDPLMDPFADEGPGAFPDDPRFGLLWGMHNAGQQGGVEDADIDAPEAWIRQTGAPGVVIAVIDTGVDYTHPDLAANIWTNEDEIPENGLDDDGNGYVDDYYGWDWANGDRDPMDDHYHGTHCAGTVAAVGDNDEGVVGVAWEARIMSLKFLDSSGSGYLSDAVYAIDYAAANGARITSNSWGGGGYSQALVDAITAAHESNVLFVAAAGNDSRDADASPAYPAAYNLPPVLSVAATNRNDELATFSNFGAQSVDLGAPGRTILSTVPGGYDYLSGTSMATPHVSGAAAMVIAKNPLLSATQVKQVLLDAVDPVAALAGKTLTGGRLNLRTALDQSSPPWFSLVPQRGSIAPGESATVGVAIHADFLPAGALSGTIALYSNDPDSPMVEIPLQISVHPAPAFHVVEEELLFEKVLRRGTEQRDLVVANSGTDPLTISEATVSGPFAVEAALPMILAPGERSIFPVTAYGSGLGTLNGQLTFQSDDPTDPQTSIDLQSFCVEAPAMAELVDRIDRDLIAGGETTIELQLANSGAHPLDFAVRSDLPEWLIAGPEAGTVSPGESGLLELQMDTTGLGEGRYAHQVTLETNDPLRPEEEILLVLDVRNGPLLNGEPEALEFAVVYMGHPQSRDLILSNDGNEPLEIQSMSTSRDVFGLLNPWTGEMAPGETRTVTVEADPANIGQRTALLTIETNEADNPVRNYSLAMNARPVPVMNTSSTGFSFELSSGQTTSAYLPIENQGSEPLEVTIAVEPGGEDIPFGEILQTFDLRDILADDAVSAAAYLNDRFYVASANFGPNIPLVHVLDAEGNLLRSFPQPGVPNGNWGIIDLATDGEFLYAGTHLRIFQMDTVGNIVRSIEKPEELVAVYGLARDPATGNFWVNGNDGDLLQLDADGTILRRFTPDLEGMFGMAWDEASPDGPFLWIAEIKELQTRRIHQFDPIAGVFTGLAFTVDPASGWSGGLSLTTGWQEGQATLLAVTQAEEDFLHMVNLSSFQDWLRLDTYSATVHPGEVYDFSLFVEPDGITGGVHTANLRVTSNDPETPERILPVELSFNGTPEMELPQPAEVRFGEAVLTGGSATETLRIRNSGSDVLTVTSLSVLGEGFSVVEATPFQLQPQESNNIQILLQPQTPGTHAGTLTIASDAPGQASVEVSMEGEAVPAPLIDVEDSPVNLSLHAGEEATFDLPLENTGGGTLRWQLDARNDLAEPTSVRSLPANLFPGEDKAYGRHRLHSSDAGPDAVVQTLPWADGFESGRWSDSWFSPYGTGKSEVTDATAGEGQYSFHYYGQTENTHFKGIYQLFEPCQPDYFSFRVRGSAVDRGHAFVTLGNQNNNHIMWFFNTGTGFWSQTEYPSGHASLRAEPDRWYHIECRNIDWQERTFDYFVDGELLQAGIEFRNDYIEAIERLDLYNFRQDTAAWWDDLRMGENTAPWLRASSSAGEVAAGGSFVPTVTASADYMEPGTYEAWLVIENNDPASPEITIPVEMTVAAAPAAHFPEDGIAFGETVTGAVSTDKLVIANSGSDPLTLTDVQTDNPAFTTEATLPLTIQPGERHVIEVSFMPTASVSYSGTLSLVDNSPFAAEEVRLTGTGIEPPAIDVDTAPLVLEVPAGESVSGSLALQNTGSGDLVITAYLDTEARTGTSSPGATTGSLEAGGPDNFGYTLVDERESPGSLFQWREIAEPEGGPGTELTSLTGLQYSSDSRDNDDAYVYPVELPFAFPFYGQDYSQIAVGAYGVVYFEDDGFGWYMTDLPTDNLAHGRGTNRFIATYNDNLDIIPGAVYVHGNEDRFIIEHYKVRSNFIESATFQTVLYPNGDIRMQWKETGPWLTGGTATIGIQGDTTTALQYGRWQGDLVESGRSIYYTYPGNGYRDWLRSDQRELRLAGGESATMDYEIEASPLLPGQYNGLIRLESNDPDTPVTEIPVQLTVTDPAAAGLTLIRNESGLVEEGGCLVLGEETLLADSPVAAMQDIVYSVTATGHGHLEVNGESANSFTQAQLAAGLVSYCHDGSDTSATTQFGFTITDGAESIGPFGTTMAVGAVNDPPVLTGPERYEAVAGLQENLTGMMVTDPDISHRYADWFLYLSVNHGTLFLEALPDGVYYGGEGSVQNNNTAEVTVETWLSRLQTNLQTEGGIQYTPDAGFQGDDTLLIQVRDNGNTGYGPEGITTLEIPITVYGEAVERWRHQHFSAEDLNNPSLEADLWGDAANPDGDAWDNLTEYFLLLDPLAGNGDPMHHSFDGVHLRIQFPQRARIPQLDWSAEWSRTPQGPWSANGVLYETLQDHGDWMLREARIPFVDGEGMFFRLSVEKAP